MERSKGRNILNGEWRGSTLNLDLQKYVLNPTVRRLPYIEGYYTFRQPPYRPLVEQIFLSFFLSFSLDGGNDDNGS